MKNKKQTFTAIISAIGMLVLIVDSKTALAAAGSGIDLCIRTVIPSLFPFFILSNTLTQTLAGSSLPLIRPITKLAGVPEGGESLLLIGLLGGYPVGAQSVATLHNSKQLSAHDARRLLGFCNNAGPAFIFGILSKSFTKPEYAWTLWLIHIFSAFLVGVVLPGKRDYKIKDTATHDVRFPDILKTSMYITSIVCGWVVVFRILIAFLRRWFLWLLPEPVQTIIIGSLELVNACTRLQSIDSEGLRFCLCSAFLAFGGACVAMQTTSVSEKIGIGAYFPGKILQTVFSFLIAYAYQSICFDSSSRFHLQHLLAACILLIVVLMYCIRYSHKKTVAFPREIVYNK